MSVRYPRGAEWRVWDFQVHTPFSELNNGFGADFDAYAKAFFEKAIEKNVAVVGVTDYFSVEGYRGLKAIQDDDAKLTSLVGQDKVASAKAIKLFPNVELRTDILVDGNRVNYHVIFSDEVSPDVITNDFLAQLHFTAEGNLADKQDVLKSEITTLGEKLSAPQKEFEEYKTLLKTWEDVRKSIIGNVEQIGSLAQLKQAIEHLPTKGRGSRSASVRD